MEKLLKKLIILFVAIKEKKMHRLAFLMGMVVIGYMPLEAAEEQNVGEEESQITEDCYAPKRGARLFYGRAIDSHMDDLNEKNYGWPGMRADAFYDHFTK
ncbi:hypothetical protein NEOC84_001804|nr:hypothetical protein [Neochlamydia sp. AcF84]